MLDALDLVHMNGRVYDPLVGRFVSADPFIQDPTNGQGYNRYSYVLNNPTNLTDPTGFFEKGDSLRTIAQIEYNAFEKQMEKLGDQFKAATGEAKEAIGQKITNLAGSLGNNAKSPSANSDSGAGVPDAGKSGTSANSGGEKGFLDKASDFVNNSRGNTPDPCPMRDSCSVGGMQTVVVRDPVKQLFVNLHQESYSFAETGCFGGGQICFGPGSIGSVGTKAVLKEVQQYALRARADGWYPVMKRGAKEAVETVWLEAGDVWKFGTTKNPLTRYSQPYLDNIGPQGVERVKEFGGSVLDAVKVQNMKILNYIEQNGALPPGNKIVN
jgi:RHS repeat-associated protein